MQTVKFNELPVSDYILQAVEEMGWENASPIQSQAIPAVLNGRDVIGQAQTGTGKTAAFGIPAIESVDVDHKATQVLILCPTRELALQVKEQMYLLSKYKKGLLVTCIYGGESYERQFRDLKRGAHIVVGTPGRIMDHLDRKTLQLSDLKMMVLDEADEMLNMGFREDIETILSQAPEERQTVLFSATMSKEILSITKRFQNDPHIIKVTREEVTNDNIEQLVFNVRRDAKTEAMCRLIDVHNLKLILVFCNTKSKVDEVAMELQARGHAAEGLHGDLRQGARTQVMNKFRNGNCNILVATDVAARGIDVNDVDAVFNYDVPMDLENYVHRIGRTGRAGKKGMAFTLAPNRDNGKLRDLERYTKVKIEQGKIPTLDDLKEVKRKQFKEKVISHISDQNIDEFADIINEMIDEGHDPDHILTALVKMQIGSLEIGSNFEDDLSDKRKARGERRSEGRRGSRNEQGDDRRGGRRNNKGQGSGEAGMVRLFINLGKKDHVSPNHIVGAIAAESKIPGRVIGQIDMYDKFSFVEVPERDVNRVLSGMKGKTINAREAAIEVAK
ncbi:DEAD/DEAH box helicase [Marinilongibacter aquaticus]|uniref:DEAD/DEAH box helicase n=1 Tax=Marinilongibacter aquaticus TaxID=2975157 RepID=UPI0021BDC85E|nr:DEAD/DEAH box helicase [Marinilongibacter aquaticus]UBM60262.1 DEAD/DEAH box helicase [Marinilongibacter aquaticus]